MTAESGWYADPYGRFERRYWSGTDWTEHVFGGGVQGTDPLATPVPSTRVATTSTGSSRSTGSQASTRPAGAVNASSTVTAATISAQVTTFLDRLGPLARERGQVNLRNALAGTAGALWAVGIILVVSNDSDASGPIAVTAALLIGAAVAGALKGSHIAGSLYALTGVVAVAVPAFVSALMSNSLDQSKFAVPALLVAVLFLGLWAAPGLRGRPLLFGAGVYALVTFIGTLGVSNTDCYEYSFSESDCISADNIRNLLSDQGWLFVLVGAVLLAGVYWSDRRGYHGIGSGLVATALLSITSGGVLIAAAVDNGSEMTGPLALLAVAGAVMAWVGSAGGRRATTWWGVAVCSLALPAAFLVAVQPSDSATGGILIILSGVVLFGLPILVSRISAANSNGGSSAVGQP